MGAAGFTTGAGTATGTGAAGFAEVPGCQLAGKRLLGVTANFLAAFPMVPTTLFAALTMVCEPSALAMALSPAPVSAACAFVAADAVDAPSELSTACAAGVRTGWVLKN